MVLRESEVNELVVVRNKLLNWLECKDEKDLPNTIVKATQALYTYIV
jgi:hypothetical protein